MVISLSDRTAIKLRVSREVNRDSTTDSTFDGLLDQWIAEAIHNIEQTVALPYTRGRQTKVVQANDATQALPADIIIHHPFTLKIKREDGSKEWNDLVQMSWQQYEQEISEPDKSQIPEFYVITGTSASENLGITFYPIPERNYTASYFGYFYTEVESWTDSNWLTDNEPNIVVALVSHMAFKHYGEKEKAEEKRQEFVILLNGDPTRGTIGLKAKALKQDKGLRFPRIRLIFDEPNARTKKNFGF